jgi:hypothetical protein
MHRGVARSLGPGRHYRPGRRSPLNPACPPRMPLARRQSSSTGTSASLAASTAYILAAPTAITTATASTAVSATAGPLSPRLLPPLRLATPPKSSSDRTCVPLVAENAAGEAARAGRADRTRAEHRVLSVLARRTTPGLPTTCPPDGVTGAGYGGGGTVQGTPWLPNQVADVDLLGRERAALR